MVPTDDVMHECGDPQRELFPISLHSQGAKAKQANHKDRTNVTSPMMFAIVPVRS
jgi:hypothetical protein